MLVQSGEVAQENHSELERFELPLVAPRPHPRFFEHYSQ